VAQPFSIDKNRVFGLLQSNPASVSNVQLRWLRNQYGPHDYMQGILAPYEHAAFAREQGQQGGIPALSAAMDIPLYQAAKALGMGSRSGFDPWQMIPAYGALYQGLTQ